MPGLRIALRRQVGTQLVDRLGALELVTAPADRFERLGQHGLEGPELGVHIGVGALPEGLRVGAALRGLGAVLVRVSLVVEPGAPAEQLLAAAVDGPDGLGEHDLEVGELAVDVVVGLGPDLLGLPAGLREDPVRLVLGLPGDLGVGDQRPALGVRGLDDPFRLGPRLLDHLLPPAEQLLRLREGARERRAHLLQHGEQLGAVDHARCRHGHGPGTADGRDDVVELLLHVHLGLATL